jgi:hypothetical protein
MDRKTSPSGARDGGTERPFVTERCVPGLSMRVPDALAFHPVTSSKDAGRSPRLRTTSDTGGSLQGRCDKTAAAGLGPCETLPNSVSGKDTDPAGSPLTQGRTSKLTPRWAVGRKVWAMHTSEIVDSTFYPRHYPARPGNPCGVGAMCVNLVKFVNAPLGANAIIYKAEKESYGFPG